jgi:signal transduction histidine kinase
MAVRRHSGLNGATDTASQRRRAAVPQPNAQPMKINPGARLDRSRAAARVRAASAGGLRVTRDPNPPLLDGGRTLRLRGRALLPKERASAETTTAQGKNLPVKERYRRLFLESQSMQWTLRRLTRQMLSAQESERKKISHELHDEVVQTLVGINVELTALRRGARQDTAALRRNIGRSQRFIEKAVCAVHRFARDLRPTVLDDLGLIPALHAFSQNLAARAEIRIQLTAFGGVESLSIAKRLVLFRVVQEALNNVARHAEASQVKIDIGEKAGVIELEITDNGKSFRVGPTLLAKNQRRLGLVGMRERIEMIGGTLAIESAPGRGTTIRARIPFKPSTKSK